MRLPLETRGSIGETWMKTCANSPPSSSRIQTVSGRNKVWPASISPCKLLYISLNRAHLDGVQRRRWGQSRLWGRGVRIRFHPMRLLLTGSSCLEKLPLWSFGPQGDNTTSMGEDSFGFRRHRQRERKRGRLGGEGRER